jgi:hypothetical protein
VGCILGLQESNEGGGWSAVAVGYDSEGALRLRIRLRFPDGGDWLLTRRTRPHVSESAAPSGEPRIETKRLREWK